MPNQPILHVDVLLSWLISESVHRKPNRRLNEIENQLSDLVRLWRPVRPIYLRRELRLSTTTLTELREWVEAEDHGEGAVALRLMKYQQECVLNETVPRGWIRLLIVLA